MNQQEKLAQMLGAIHTILDDFSLNLRQPFIDYLPARDYDRTVNHFGALRQIVEDMTLMFDTQEQIAQCLADYPADRPEWDAAVNLLLALHDADRQRHIERASTIQAHGHAIEGTVRRVELVDGKCPICDREHDDLPKGCTICDADNPDACDPHGIERPVAVFAEPDPELDVMQRAIGTGSIPHPCVIPGCYDVVPYDDEPWCYTHSPDEGSNKRGYSWLRDNNVSTTGQIEHAFRLAAQWNEGQITNTEFHAGMVSLARDCARFANTPDWLIQQQEFDEMAATAARAESQRQEWAVLLHDAEMKRAQYEARYGKVNTGPDIEF